MRSAFTVSSWNMLCRLTGFAREVVIAGKMGASGMSDAFFVALTLPNLLRRIFAEGAFNVAFVPILSKILEQKGQQEAEKFAASALVMLSLVLLVITLCACVFMPQVVLMVAGGFKNNPDVFHTAVLLGRITFPYLMLITVASLFGSICNTLGRFWAYAFVPMLLNFSFIGCAFVLEPFGVLPEVALAVAMPLGGLLQAAFMWWAVHKSGFVVQLGHTSARHADIKPLLVRMGPAALSVGILQISFIIDTQIASFLAEKSISYLQYATRFYQFPLSMIGVTMATVLLPHLSRSMRRHDKTAANEAFGQSVVYGMALGLACSVGLFMLAHPLFATFFERGSFTAETSRHAAAAMMAYCVGLPAFILTKITATAFYANEDTRTPLYTSVLGLVVNVVFNLLLMGPLGYVGIALATSISGWFNAGAQLYLLRRGNFLHINNKRVFKGQLLWVAGIGLLMFAAMNLWEAVVPFPAAAFILKLLWVGGATAFGSAVFLMVGHRVRLFHLGEIKRKIMRRA